MSSDREMRLREIRGWLADMVRTQRPYIDTFTCPEEYDLGEREILAVLSWVSGSLARLQEERYREESLRHHYEEHYEQSKEYVGVLTEQLAALRRDAEALVAALDIEGYSDNEFPELAALRSSLQGEAGK